MHTCLHASDLNTAMYNAIRVETGSVTLTQMTHWSIGLDLVAQKITMVSLKFSSFITYVITAIAN